MDPVYLKFLENTYDEARRLAEKSDVLKLSPIPPFPPGAYLCEFHVAHLRLLSDGTVRIEQGPVTAGVIFPEDYLRSTDPRLYLRVASALTPFDLLHPNVRGGVVCLGAAFAPGTSLTALLWELYEIVSYQNVTLDERNAMNPTACRLLRQQPELLSGLRPEPFLRRRHGMQVSVKQL
jgi:hypothetical protein